MRTLVINHTSVQPNLSRFSVVSVIRTRRNEYSQTYESQFSEQLPRSLFCLLKNQLLYGIDVVCVFIYRVVQKLPVGGRGTHFPEE